MKTWVLLLVVVLVGCGSESESCHGGWGVVGPTKPLLAQLAVQVAIADAPCKLEDSGGLVQFAAWPKLTGLERIDGIPDGTACLALVRSDAPGGPVKDTSLIHSVGHVLWAQCGKASTRGDGVDTDQFLAWVDQTQSDFNSISGQ